MGITKKLSLTLGNIKKYAALVAFLFISLSSFSQNVSPEEIRTAINNWLINNERTDYSIAKIEEQNDNNGNRVLYTISLNPTGFVVVSPEKNIVPVLGYSFSSSISKDNEPAMEWINNYANQISASFGKKNYNEKNQTKWNELLSPSTKKSSKKSTYVVAPLVHAKWNQSSGWNKFCPEDAKGPGGRVYVGCVSVAMSMIMKKWEHPTKGNSSNSYTHDTYGVLSADFQNTTYEWSKMSDTNADDYNALLLYHCAVSVNMGFSPTGSGASVYSARYALESFFDYSANRVRQSSYSDDEWVALFKTELDAQRPILHAGYKGDASGHAFVCDGYTNDGYFHINWGWGGYHDGNFLINALTPGDRDYSEEQEAVIGIQPTQYANNPDLVPHKPIEDNYNWSGEIVIKKKTVASEKGIVDEDIINVGEDAYVNFAVKNISQASSVAPFTVKIEVDGTEVLSIDNTDKLESDKIFTSINKSIGNFAAGDHTIKMIIDKEEAVLEAIETNNEFSKTFTVPVDKTYMVRATVNPTEAGTATGTGAYVENSAALIETTPAEGYQIVNWKDGNTVVSTNTSYPFNVTADRDLVIYYELKEYDVITTTSLPEGGTITGDGKYKHGDTVTLQATPKEGYEFIKWLVDGKSVSTKTEYSFTASKNITAQAVFELKTCKLTLSLDPTDGGELTGAGDYKYGEQVTIKATAKDRHNFVKWENKGNEFATTMEHSFTITEDMTLKAVFYKILSIDNVKHFDAKVYPNPASTLIKVEVKNNINTDNIMMRLSDITGKTNTNINFKRNGSSLDIDVSNYRTGEYYLTIIADDKVETFSILIAR